MAKASKQEAGYGPGNPRKNCGICQMMRTAEAGTNGGRCTAVAGRISVYGVCQKYFKSRTNPWRKKQKKRGLLGGKKKRKGLLG